MTRPQPDVLKVDIEGFRALNADRKPAVLLKEAIQNSLDTQATTISVIVGVLDGVVTLNIVDDAPEGVQDLVKLFTLYGSSKADDPTKRGRMGRGLKELVSVSDETIIETTTGRVRWVRERKGKWTFEVDKASRRPTGTNVHMRFRSWKPRDVNDMVAFATSVVAPEGVTYTVNGQAVQRTSIIERATLDLTTVVFIDGVERKMNRSATALLYAVQGRPSLLFEMGIPIQEIECPFDVDVQQRVPMNPNRDVVSVQYLRSLYAQVLNLRHENVEPEQLGDEWVLEAAQSRNTLLPEVREKITQHFTKGAFLAKNKEEMHRAENHHIKAVRASDVPGAVRDLVREVAPPVSEALAEIEQANTHQLQKGDWNADQRRWVEVHEFLATKAGLRCTIHLCKGNISKAADFQPGGRVYTIYVDVVGKAFFRDPISVASLHLTIHELSHWNYSEHEHVHLAEFSSDAEEVGAKIARALWDNRDEIFERWFSKPKAEQVTLEEAGA